MQILPSRGVQSQLTEPVARLIEHDLLANPSVHAGPGDRVKLWLERGEGPGPAARSRSARRRDLPPAARSAPLGPATGAGAIPVVATPTGPAVKGYHLTNVAPSVGLDFRQGSFRFGMSNDYRAMMGGGVCWLDYNDDGWVDLFAVNSYASADTTQWEAHGGLPRTALFENVHGTFTDVSVGRTPNLPVQGDGCVAADLNGDGRTDLVVTTTTGIDLLWNNGDGTFTEGARCGRLTASGWYTGAAVADVNGDGRPDVFIAGYADPNDPVPNSLSGFPTNLAGVRDLLYLNEGTMRRPRAFSRGRLARPGSRPPAASRARRPVHRLQRRRPTRPLRRERRGSESAVRERRLAGRRGGRPGRARVPVRGAGRRRGRRRCVRRHGGRRGRRRPKRARPLRDQLAPRVVGRLQAVRSNGSPAFADARPSFDPALGNGFAGWGVSWVDLSNTGQARPRSDRRRDPGHEPLRRTPSRCASSRRCPGTARASGPRRAPSAPTGLRLNGRGLAAADVDNDGRMEVAINTIGGKLVLLRPTGPVGHWLEVRLSRFSPGRGRVRHAS